MMSPTRTPIPRLTTLAAFASGQALPVAEAHTTFRAGAHETPLPADLWLAAGFQVPTGHELADPVARLVAEAQAVLHTLSFLPVDPEAESRAKTWLAAQEPERTGRAIPRRRPGGSRSLPERWPTVYDAEDHAG